MASDPSIFSVVSSPADEATETWSSLAHGLSGANGSATEPASTPPSCSTPLSCDADAHDAGAGRSGASFGIVAASTPRDGAPRETKHPATQLASLVYSGSLGEACPMGNKSGSGGRCTWIHEMVRCRAGGSHAMVGLPRWCALRGGSQRTRLERRSANGPVGTEDWWRSKRGVAVAVV